MESNPAPESDTKTLEHSSLTIEWWPIERLKPYPGNARVIPPEAVSKVAASLRLYGWRQPVVAEPDGTIVIGHVRRLGALENNEKIVPVHVAADLSPEKLRALRLADNRLHQETTWDDAILKAEFMELDAMNVDIPGMTGFNEEEVNDIFKLDLQADAAKPEGDNAAAGFTDEDEVPEAPAHPITIAGDIWVMGDHRLMCGNATNMEAVTRLVDGVPIAMIFSDPPYNVDYEGYTKDKLTIQSDKMSPPAFRRFLELSFSNWRRVLAPDGSLYVCHASSVQRDFQNALERAGFSVRCQIIWGKNTFAWGFGRYKFQHEPIFYGCITGASDNWYGDKSQSTLWQEKKPAANRLHPTMKPVELIDRALKNSSRPGDVVLDTFGGSGSTLISCHKLKRSARLLELDPKYADVIVTRWQEFSGNKATLEGDGRTFEEITAERRPVVVSQ